MAANKHLYRHKCIISHVERNVVYLTLHTLPEVIDYCVRTSNIEKELDCSLRNSKHVVNLSFHRQAFRTNCKSWSSRVWQALWGSRSPQYPTCVLGYAVFPLNFTGIRPIIWDKVFHRAIRAHSFGLSSQNIRQLCLGSWDGQYLWSTTEGTTLARNGRDWGITLKPRSELLQEKLWAFLLTHVPSCSSAVMLHTQCTGPRGKRVFDAALQTWKMKIQQHKGVKHKSDLWSSHFE